MTAPVNLQLSAPYAWSGAAARTTGSPSCAAGTSCGPAAAAPIAGPLWPAPNSRMQKLNENDHESNGADYRTSHVPSKL
jgi:hypothetical protein